MTIDNARIIRTSVIISIFNDRMGFYS